MNTQATTGNQHTTTQKKGEHMPSADRVRNKPTRWIISNRKWAQTPDDYKSNIDGQRYALRMGSNGGTELCPVHVADADSELPTEHFENETDPQYRGTYEGPFGKAEAVRFRDSLQGTGAFGPLVVASDRDGWNIYEFVGGAK